MSSLQEKTYPMTSNFNRINLIITFDLIISINHFVNLQNISLYVTNKLLCRILVTLLEDESMVRVSD